jgi:hypothetical protein
MRMRPFTADCESLIGARSGNSPFALAIGARSEKRKFVQPMRCRSRPPLQSINRHNRRTVSGRRLCTLTND